MKKISWLLILLIAIAALAFGCGKDKDEEDAPKEPDISIDDPAVSDDLPKEEPQEPDAPALSPEDVPKEDPGAAQKPNNDKPATKPIAPTAPTKPATPPVAPTAPPEAPKPEPTSLSAKDIVAKVLANVDSPDMMEFDADTIATLYGIDTSAVKSYCVKGPVMNVKVNEIAVFELSDASDAATFKKACEKRASDVAKTFEHYLEDQYAIAKAPSIVASGNYVFMAISENAVTMSANFKKLI